LSNGFDAPHNTPIRQDTMQTAHHFVAGEAISFRIEAKRSDVLQQQPAIPIVPLQPLDFTAAERAIAVIEQLI
jgi:hypothetical protein